MSLRLGNTSLTTDQNDRLRREVAGQRVLDIGCGTGQLAVHMRDVLGATVTGLDKERFLGTRTIPFLQANFSTVQIDSEQFDVGVLAWPSDTPAVIRVLQELDRLVVISKTTDGTMCGSRALWEYLCQRELLDEVRDRSNTLLVYGGPHTRLPVARCEEETCGLLSSHRLPPIAYGALPTKIGANAYELLAAAEGF